MEQAQIREDTLHAWYDEPGGVQVRFGAKPALDVEVESDTQLRCRAPASGGELHQPRLSGRLDLPGLHGRRRDVDRRDLRGEAPVLGPVIQATNVLFDLAAVLAKRGATGTQIGQKLGTIVVELLRQPQRAPVPPC